MSAVLCTEKHIEQASGENKTMIKEDKLQVTGDCLIEEIPGLMRCLEVELIFLGPVFLIILKIGIANLQLVFWC